MKTSLRGLLAAPLATLAMLAAVLFTWPSAAWATTPTQTPLNLVDGQTHANVPECAYTANGGIVPCHVLKVWNGTAWIDLVVDASTGALVVKTNNGALDTTLQSQQAAPGSDSTKAVGVQGCTNCKAVATKPQDSAGGDASDPANHAYRVNCVVGCGGGGSSGNVGGYSTVVSAAPAVQASAYSIGQSLGGLFSLNLARTNGGSGTLTDLRIRSKSGQAFAGWVYAWTKQPTTTCTDQATFVSNDADAAYALPGFPQAFTMNVPGSWETASYGQIPNINMQFVNQDTTPGKAIWFCIVLSTAIASPGPTTTSDLTINGSAIQD